MNNAMEVISKAEKHFVEINVSSENELIWKSEAHFAMQAVVKNDGLAKAVHKSPDSLKSAVVNVASVGLSLNPATSYAYLVPRDDRVCLDISYKGLIKMATDTGSIIWCRADVVYEADAFEYKGPAAAPVHVADPFSDRGDVVGVYCIAKTVDGDYLIEVMKESEVQEIKAKSPSSQSKYSPWNTFENEMRKKSVIKRASKTWPMTDRHERLAKVIEYVNKEEGIDFDELSEEDIKLFDDYLHEKNGAAIANLKDGDVDKALYWAKIQKSFAAKGKIGKHDEMVQGWVDDAIEYVSSIAVTIQENANKESIVLEVFDELNEHELQLFKTHLSPEAKINVENILHTFGITL